jgi:hypothetical protein
MSSKKIKAQEEADRTAAVRVECPVCSSRMLRSNFARHRNEVHQGMDFFEYRTTSTPSLTCRAGTSGESSSGPQSRVPSADAFGFQSMPNLNVGSPDEGSRPDDRFGGVSLAEYLVIGTAAVSIIE